MKVFVAGATGVLGRAAVKALAAAGHDVRGTARGEEKAALLRAAGAEPVTVDLYDAEAVKSAVAGSEAVVHLATKIPPLTKVRSRKAWAENDRLRTEAAHNLVDAAIAAGAQTYIQEAITFVYADGGDRWLGEDATVAVEVGPLRTALVSEAEAQRFTEAGGRGVALRFGAFYGPDAPSTIDSVRMARRRMMPVIGRGDNFFSSIHSEDAGSAVVAALSVPTGVYNVVEDEPVTMREYSRTLAEVFGAPRPLRVPKWVAGLVIGEPAKYITRSQRVSNRRFKEATGWSPRFASVREGFAEIAEAWARAD